MHNLLLLVSHRATLATSCAGVLTTGTEVPVVTQTTVGTNLLQTLKVITELGLDVVRQDLRVLTSREVLLSVKEPRRDLELLRRLEDIDNTFQFIRVELTGAVEVLVHVHFYNQGKIEHCICGNTESFSLTCVHTYRLRRSMSAFLHTMLA